MWPPTLSFPPKRLKLLRFLQNGKTSQVYTSYSPESHEVYVIKRFKKKYMTNKDTDLVRNEVNINEMLSHPNILEMHGHWETKYKLYMLFEYANQGDLFDHIHKSKPTAHMIIDIVQAISYLHANGVVHYDIKPENIFVLDGRVLLADFGLSIDKQNPRRYTNRCTLEYTAPEQVNMDEFPENLEAIDSWCVGILLYEVSHGCTPFVGLGRETVMREVMKPIICEEKMYEPVIKNLTQQAPERRMDFSEIIKFLSMYV